MKKAGFVFLISLLLLLGTISWEYVFDRQGEDNWIARFEERLHRQEMKADELLNRFKDTVDIDDYAWNEDVVFVGFRNDKLFFWTNENVGEEGLFALLRGEENFIKINNIFYEVRRKSYGDADYFALIHIKDDYPYKNQYVKNQFGQFLHIATENADNIKVNRLASEGGRSVVDKDGHKLFYILHNENYKDRSANYVLLAFYILFFLSLFYVFSLLLQGSSSLKTQLFCIAGFIVFILLLRFVMIKYSIPDVVYRLRIFDNTASKNTFVASVGDLFLLAFCICQVLYLSFTYLKIDYQNIVFKRFRFLFIVGFVTFVFFYVNFFNSSVKSVIESTGVHLNIARIVSVEASSIIAFIAVIMEGLGLLVIMDGSAAIFKDFMKLPVVLKIVSGVMLFFAGISYFFDLYINLGECIFVWGLYLLIIVNRYNVKRDVQRSIYMLLMFLLSLYMVVTAKKYEQYKELIQRAEFATELIEERDYNFENKLLEISRQIETSQLMRDLIANYDEVALRNQLTNEFMNLTGYNYVTDITLCRGNDSLMIEPGKELWECHGYFDQLIRKYGSQIEESVFYLIEEFDGFVSYIGKFTFANVSLYLRFDSAKDSEGSGYPQVLSRKSVEGKNVAYPYSYAKYKNGELIFSSGDFNYYKSVERFGEQSGNIDIFDKDGYSHMLIPAEDGGVLVMSLHNSIFSLYLMNVLYVFFVIILISSYGLFFSSTHNINFRRGTLKARIKNSIVSLIFILFVILTALSIYLNSKSFEKRHNAKATELLKFINKELERLNCVDSQKCPEIMRMLSEMSEILLVDINIYNVNGKLVATSRPEIFSTGFDGYLINPRALKKIVKDGQTSYIDQEKIGELDYMSAYIPLILENKEAYILNVPYFRQNDELNLDIVIMVIIAVNIAIVVMVLAFLLSGLVAERVTKPLQLVNEKLKKMRFGGKNEKIVYHNKDEVGALVQEYNNMVEKLDESINKLAKSERESAWREMARQIAHEIKNPLTPMKLNIQFMQRSLQIEDPAEFKERFKDISAILIEQIDNMASIASAFSNFAKMPVANSEMFDICEMVNNSAKLFEKNVDTLECNIDTEILVFADREQFQRVLVNVLKNAEQSIPEDKSRSIKVKVEKKGTKVVIRISDNGVGIPEDIREKIFEPNFTTKSSGTGLGLAISRRIMESMGGTIDFVSTPGVGTEFFITLDCIR